MFKLLLILFIVNFYAGNNIFKRIRKKHGQGVLKVAKTLENLKTKYVKAQADVKFIKPCTSENIVPTFAKVNLSLKHSNHKLKSSIAKIVMEAELQNKHREKKKLQKEIKQIGVEVNSVLGIILYSSLIYQINGAVSSRRVAISVRHKNKIENFRGRQQKQEQPYAEMKINKHIIHKYSTYSLSNEQYIALSYGLDTHIPSRTNANMVYTEFEVLY